MSTGIVAPTQMVLESDVVQGFLDVVTRCLRSTVGVEAIVAAVADPDQTLPTITVVVDLVGDFRGPVTWQFPPSIALELVRRLMDDPNPSPDSAAEGATELANILTGRASEALEAHGFVCEMGPPRVHVGALPTGLNVRMTTTDGPIDVILSLVQA